ncbi:ATP-binding protein [Variovorax ureilyticus]|uniref:histidine kinase n=1 Tax=Variovorax ureilyticus TaxID=1836198 RepID=A0ABU8VA45_9BURK
MSWVTFLWAMVSAACLTLAAVHLPVWLKDRSAWPSFFFAMLCVSTAGLALGELQMMYAQTPDAYAAALRLAHVPVLGLYVAAIGFVRSYFGTGRPWLGWLVIGLRTATLLPNFFTGQSLNLATISHLEAFPLLGENVSVAIGTPNPWMVLAHLSASLMVLFVLDASIGAWRRGDRRTSLTVGGGFVFFALAGTVQSMLVFWGVIRMPISVSLLSLLLVIAMGYELSRHVLHTASLVRELRESQERMALATEAASLGIWMFDFSRRTFWASARMRGLLGFSQTEPWDLDRVLQRVDEEDRAVVRQALAETSQGVPSYHFEFRVHAPDGRTRWIAAQGQIEFDDRGHARRARGACADVTDRKEAEHQLMQLRLELAHAGRVSAMGHLASSLAHEINQPLGAILRNTEAALLLLQAQQPDLEEIRAILADILGDDQRAGTVIDRMRAMLRHSAMAIEPLAVDDLLSDVAALVRPDAAARHVRVVLDIADDLPPVLGDSVHLQQVLLNLISNGMDSIDEAGRKVRQIVVSAIRAGARKVEIAVSDSGGGIPQDCLEEVFGSFYTTKPSGLGMGLSISRSLVEAHGGRLWAENRSEGGARLRFTLRVPSENPA